MEKYKYTKRYCKDQREEYELLLTLVGSLSNLFSENFSPFLHYRAHENLFCKAFEAKNLARGDISYDALKDGVGIGLKTFLNGKGKSFQKVAEFNNKSDEIRKLANDRKKIVHKIAKLRNERLKFAQNSTKAEKSFYHLVTRKPGKMNIVEVEMDFIDIDSIKLEKSQPKNTIRFKDDKNDYSFSLSKNTLLQRFDTTESKVIREFSVEILEDPLEYLRSKIIKEEVRSEVDLKSEESLESEDQFKSEKELKPEELLNGEEDFKLEEELETEVALELEEDIKARETSKNEKDLKLEVSMETREDSKPEKEIKFKEDIKSEKELKSNKKFKLDEVLKYENDDTENYIILPLYSPNTQRVQEKSGLNQWNAAGRKRNPNEVYIPIPAWIHDKFKGFFEYSRVRKFRGESAKHSPSFIVKLPDNTEMKCKVAQQGGKALMSAPNSALGQWILRDVLELKEGQLLTYEKLEDIGIDSVKLTKLSTDSYELDFVETGSYEEFVEEHN